MRLIINGYDIQLDNSQKISRTLQVNDILTLSNRQSNYTNTFSIKKTDTNKQAFEYLGVVGSTTVLPYRKNECYLYTDEGECLVYKGWAVIQSTDKDYKINIYDGNIDLYKAIENKSLGDLDLSEIDHSKNLATVLNSFTSNLPYKYIVADFNGKMIYNNNRINIDYLVPSAKISYLWDKIFSTYGFTYEGSVFNTVNFTNLWLSYPKFLPLSSQVTPTTIFQGSTIETTDDVTILPFRFDQSVTTDTIEDIDKQQFIIKEQGVYDILLTDIGGGELIIFIEGDSGLLTILGRGRPAVFKNGVFVGLADTTLTLNLLPGDIINCDFSLPTGLPTSYNLSYNGSFEFNLKIEEYQGAIVSFSNELKDFSIKDFISEILNRFGLTPFKDKYSNHYKFLTLQELLQNNQITDWTSKFVEKLSEKYIFGSYAQENKFTYKYNDQEDEYYDSAIIIDNVNIQDTKTVVNSRIYAPDENRINLIHDLTTNVYRMWDKEIKEDGTITYKGLSKRYYLMREDSHTFTSPTEIGSESLNTHTSITTIPIESFYNLRMEDIIREYYKNIGQILIYSKIIEASFYLNETDIVNIDFSRLYWIKRLSNYFLLNKVNNFTKKGITKCELIKVDYNPIITNPKINFGLGLINKTANVNQIIKVYQELPYPIDFDIISLPSDVTVVSQTLYYLEIKYTTTGSKSFNITITNSLISNTLTINIV